jgi:hypothetical protein
MVHEDAVAGLQLNGMGVTGSYSPTGEYRGNSPGASEFDFEEDILGTLRVLPRGQITLLVPWIQTQRTVPGASEMGGGLGDINLSARYDFLLARESLHVPGIALLLGATFPTGKAVDVPNPSYPLGTDATGTGAYQATAGLGLEQVYGPVLLGVTGMLSYPFPRSVPGIGTQQLGLLFFGVAQAAYTFENEAALGLALTYQGSGDTTISGAPSPALDGRQLHSGRAKTVVALAGALPVGDGWRLQANLSQGVPISGLGQNMPIGFGVSFTVLKAWL